MDLMKSLNQQFDSMFAKLPSGPQQAPTPRPLPTPPGMQTVPPKMPDRRILPRG